MSKVASVLSGRSAGWIVVALIASSAAGVAVASGAGASPAPPPLNISPHGSYHDAQTITVGVGPNGYFTPHARVNVIECADPGGSAANLPKDITTCDGNTIQGNSILVGNDGSFSVSAYPVYLLPSPGLGEQSNAMPICNQATYCVLYVGQDQNDFTAPKVFSAPFVVTPSSGGSTTTAGSTGSSGSGTVSSTAAPVTSSTTTGAGTVGVPTTSTASSSAALASTGSPPGTVWMATSAMALLLTGVVGRRLALKGVRR